MDGSRSLQRLVARGLMLVAALVSVCAFHSASLDSSSPVATGTGVLASAQEQLAGPMHLGLNEVPATYASAEQHAHPAAVVLLGMSLSLLLLGLVARASRLVAVRDGYGPSAGGRSLSASGPPGPPTPSLTQLRISRT